MLEAVTLRDGERVPFSFLFLFLGAVPCTDWLGDIVARDDHGFILTGSEARSDALLETSVAGVYAIGDVRSGSIKRSGGGQQMIVGIGPAAELRDMPASPQRARQDSNLRPRAPEARALSTELRAPGLRVPCRPAW